MPLNAPALLRSLHLGMPSTEQLPPRQFSLLMDGGGGPPQQPPDDGDGGFGGNGGEGDGDASRHSRMMYKLFGSGYAHMAGAAFYSAAERPQVILEAGSLVIDSRELLVGIGILSAAGSLALMLAASRAE